MPDNLYVDVHVLQDVPPANLNRDDSGTPKSARYGGVERLRVSSQAWKRAVRKDFQARLDPSTLGLRTRRLVTTLQTALVGAGVADDQATSIAMELLDQVKKPGSKGRSTLISSGKQGIDGQYLFFSRPQLTALIGEVVARRELWGDAVELSKQIDVKEVLGRGHSLDVALFGRMVADLSTLNVDAACQVAHAIATHASPTQYDYFTAVDDAQDRDESGAGMIGTIEFSSATLYRYATVNVNGLVANMDDMDKAVTGVGDFLRSFAMSMPTGHQNTFAAHTRPALVLVQVRTDQPVNLVSAFERPVQAGERGYVVASMERLAQFLTDEAGRWGDKPLLSVASYQAGIDRTEAFGQSCTLDQLIDAVTSAVSSRAHDE